MKRQMCVFAAAPDCTGSQSSTDGIAMPFNPERLPQPAVRGHFLAVGMVLDDTSPAAEGLIDENQPILMR